MLDNELWIINMRPIKFSFVVACVLSLSACTSTNVYPIFSAESKTVASRDFDIGYRYQNGIGVPRNYANAVEAYKRAEKSGDVRAMNNLGVMALRGQLGSFVGGSASSYFKKAAEAGSANGYYNLALLDEVGSSKPDYERAFTNYKIAANMGHAAAQFRLAQMYENGIGTPVNHEQAKTYFGLSELGGNSEALARLKALGHKHLSKRDVINIVAIENCDCETSADKAMADRSLAGLQELAKRGDAPARYNLGVKYLNGEGAPRNASKAARYFTLAGRQGYAPAQRQLAQMYLRGDGIAPSKILGHAWLNLASRSHGTDGALARSEMQSLELSMSNAEIREAQQIATSGALRGR